MITLESLATVLIVRASGVMIEAGMDTTFSSNNMDLLDPISAALRRLGYEAPISGLTDSHVSVVDNDDLNPLLDLAELRILESFLGKYTAVDITVGDRSEKFSQLAMQVRQRASFLRQSVKSYGIDASTADEGAIVLDYAESTGTSE